MLLRRVQFEGKVRWGTDSVYALGTVATAMQWATRQKACLKRATCLCPTLKIKEITSSIPNMFKFCGFDRCARLAHMAAYANEDTDDDPFN